MGSRPISFSRYTGAPVAGSNAVLVHMVQLQGVGSHWSPARAAAAAGNWGLGPCTCTHPVTLVVEDNLILASCMLAVRW